MNRIYKWMTQHSSKLVALLVLLMSSALFTYCTWAWLDDSQSVIVSPQSLQMQAYEPVEEDLAWVSEADSPEEATLPVAAEEPRPEPMPEPLPEPRPEPMPEPMPEPLPPEEPAVPEKKEIAEIAYDIAPAIAEGKKGKTEQGEQAETAQPQTQPPAEDPPSALLGVEGLGQVHANLAYEPLHEHHLPEYYQNDYPDNRYGAGTIATNGCGVTSLAMIATYLTGHEYLPDELARWFGGRAENNIKRMEIGATTMGLPWYRAENILVATDALKNGKIVVMMMDGFEFENPFTTSQHFIVIRGITKDGKYLVSDPNRQNYQKPELKEGFEKGFSFETIVAGYGGAWIFNPNGMPQNYQPYHKNEPPRQDNYPGLHLTAAEQDLIAKLIWAEARGESAEGQQAVAEVVLNRYVSGQFGNTIEWVVLGPGQFRGADKIDEAEPWQAQYDAIDAARYGTPVLEKDVFYFATRALTSRVYAIIGGHIFCRAELPEEPVPEDTQPPEEPEETEPTEFTEETEPAEDPPDSREPGILHLQSGGFSGITHP